LEDNNLFKHHLIAHGKIQYAKGQRPNVSCILCAVRDDSPEVSALKIYQDPSFFISLNLYPYNPGHLMIIPSKHIQKLEDLSNQDRIRIFELVVQCQKMIQELFNPSGFNVGYNQGQFSGASIDHFHIHVVPRYKSELGFIDIIGQTRVVVESVQTVYEKIKARIGEFVKPQ
jgi:ATP adenylyltransferase